MSYFSLRRVEGSVTRLILLLSFCLLPAVALAQAAPPEKIGSADTWVSILSSLLIVIGVIVALGFLMKRFNVVQSNGAQMQVVASMMAGARERIVVIQVGDEQHLVGITAHNINHLARLEHPIKNEQASGLLSSSVLGSNVPGSGMRNRFAQILQKQQNSATDQDNRNQNSYNQQDNNQQDNIPQNNNQESNLQDAGKPNEQNDN